MRHGVTWYAIAADVDGELVADWCEEFFTSQAAAENELEACREAGHTEYAVYPLQVGEPLAPHVTPTGKLLSVDDIT